MYSEYPNDYAKDTLGALLGGKEKFIYGFILSN